MAEEIYGAEDFNTSGLTESEKRNLYEMIRMFRATRRGQTWDKIRGGLQASLAIAGGEDPYAAEQKYHPQYGMSLEEKQYYSDEAEDMLRIAADLEGKKITSMGKIIEMKAKLQTQMTEILKSVVAGEYALAGSKSTAKMGAMGRIIQEQQDLVKQQEAQYLEPGDPARIESDMAEFLTTNLGEATVDAETQIKGSPQFWQGLNALVSGYGTPADKKAAVERAVAGINAFENVADFRHAAKGWVAQGDQNATNVLKMYDDAAKDRLKALVRLDAAYTKINKDSQKELAAAGVRPSLMRGISDAIEAVGALSTDPKTQEALTNLIKQIDKPSKVGKTSYDQALKYLEILNSDSDDPPIKRAREALFAQDTFKKYTSNVTGVRPEKLQHTDLRIGLRELLLEQREESGSSKAESSANAHKYRARRHAGLEYDEKDDVVLPEEASKKAPSDSAVIAQPPAVTDQSPEDITAYEAVPRTPPPPEEVTPFPPSEDVRNVLLDGKQVTLTMAEDASRGIFVTVSSEGAEDEIVTLEDGERLGQILEAWETAPAETATEPPTGDAVDVAAPPEATPPEAALQGVEGLSEEEMEEWLNSGGYYDMTAGEFTKKEEHTLAGEEGLERGEGPTRKQIGKKAKKEDREEARGAKKAAKAAEKEFAQSPITTGAPILADIKSRQEGVPAAGGAFGTQQVEQGLAQAPQGVAGSQDAAREMILNILTGKTGKQPSAYGADLIRRRLQEQEVSAGTTT